MSDKEKKRRRLQEWREANPEKVAAYRLHDRLRAGLPVRLKDAWHPLKDNPSPWMKGLTK